MALTDNLLAYWKFDEGGGTSAADATGNGNAGTLVNGPTWVAGKINNGISSDGSGQYVQSPSLPLSGGELSIALWVNPPTFKSTLQAIWRADTISNFALYDSNNTLSFYDASFHNSTFSVSPGWHYIVFTIDASNNVYLYADGSQVLNVTSARSAGSSSFRFAGDAFGQDFAGVVDEIGLWSRALTVAEVSQLYNGGAGLQYPFSAGPSFNPAWARGANRLLSGGFAS